MGKGSVFAMIFGCLARRNGLIYFTRQIFQKNRINQTLPMKNLITIGVLLCWACAKPINHEEEKAIITKLIEDESKYAAAADSAKWASCWVNNDDARFMYASADQSVE